MNRVAIALLAALLIVSETLASGAFASTRGQPMTPPATGKGLTQRWLRTDLPHAYVRGEIYVRIQPNRTIDDVMRRHRLPGPARPYFPPPYNASAIKAGLDKSFILQVPTGEEKQIVERLSPAFGNATGPDFIWVAIGWRAEGWATLSPNDQYYTTTGPGIARPQEQYLTAINMWRAWDKDVADTSIKVAVVDSGLRGDHVDMAATTKQFAGWDYVNNRGTVPGENFEWHNGYSCYGNAGHGTHVASIAVAETNNAVGVAGAGFNAGLIPMRRLYWDPNLWDETSQSWGKCVFWYGEAQRGWEIKWATDQGADVINLSYTFGLSDWGFENQAVEYARNENRVVVSTAGNAGVREKWFPCGYQYVLCVAASYDDGSACCSTNRGPWVDYAIPGYLIGGAGIGTSSTYVSGSATSYAAPVLSGVIAILAAHPQRRRNFANIEHDLWVTSRPAPAFWNGSFYEGDWVNFGRIDAGAAAWYR